ncbi:acidic leucine-rich nuclear phosphoprotein 32-related protein 1-like [Typha latifolia]|uniref:acidic leucine-rich nuclear phosphoprotein 32-related protein 1-like n=1 Tax=Typha latifolia TaxID=4733 RepID=UPI003C2D8985
MADSWEQAVAAALKSHSSSSPPRTLTLDGAVKSVNGRLPSSSLFERFQTLDHLSLANVRLSSLEGFPRLPKLRRLVLSDNRIAGGLGELIEAGLGELRDLDLSNNRIQAIDDLAPLAKLGLVSLDLYECPVTKIKGYRSKMFEMIPSLKYLDKMDADGKERLDSDEEEEESDVEEIDDDEEDEDENGEIEEESDGEEEDDEDEAPESEVDAESEESESEEVDDDKEDCGPPTQSSLQNKRKRDREDNLVGESNKNSKLIKDQH